MPSTIRDVCIRTVVLLSVCGGGIGCHDLTGSQTLPAGTPNPSVYKTKAGAIGLRNAAIFQLESAVISYIGQAGLLTDELREPRMIGSTSTATAVVAYPLDERIFPEGTSDYGSGVTYYALQATRGAANLAINALATYDTVPADRPTQHVLRAELYAMQGYADMLLAELFCSGVPLSTLDFQQDFTYASSSTTDQVFKTAIQLLDTARTLAQGNDSVLHLAQVLQGRAYLARGNYVAAADDVVNVPENFQYTLAINLYSPTAVVGGNANGSYLEGSVADQEGLHGLPFRSSGDSRTATTPICFPSTGSGGCQDTVFFPTKYAAAFSGSGYTPFIVADGIEARLIQAEAQLQPATNPTGLWLATLNTLRTNAGLDPLTDPGATLSGPAAATARIALLFRERAFWLFLTGHRQGDLRRLVRQYSQYAAFSDPNLLYPSGAYLAQGTGRYGTDVTVPIPTTEDINPNYHGCLSRNP